MYDFQVFQFHFYFLAEKNTKMCSFKYAEMGNKIAVQLHRMSFEILFYD